MMNRYLQQHKQDRFFNFADFETDAVKGYLPNIPSSSRHSTMT